MAGKTVLSVGQCSMDHSSISSLLVSSFHAGVETADTLGNAMAIAREGRFDLVLVNRVFDQTGELGLDFIGQYLGESGGTVPVMLVSNFPEAQEHAVALGAKPGFGKASLRSPATQGLLARYLGGDD